MPAILIGGLGLLIGSFLNVVIFRVPAGRSIVSPPSACGGCGGRIRAWDNIPLLSWIVLRGRCRDCRVKISARYPLVELGTAVFFGAVAWKITSGSSGLGWFADADSASGAVVKLAAVLLALVAFLYLAAVSVALAMIDLDTHTLPNRIVLPAYPVGAVLLTLAALVGGEQGRLFFSLIGGAALFGLYLLLALISPRGMGMGDVKLAGVLGLFLGWVGWAPLVVGAFSAFLLGGLFSFALLVSHRVNRKSSIPFGPWMLAGAWLGIFYGEQIARGYLSLFGLA